MKSISRKAQGKADQPDSAFADRLPPHSPEAERGLIGCVLDVEGRSMDVMNACEERGVSKEWFYALQNQLVWESMRALHKAGKTVEVIGLQQLLKDRGQLEEAGGIPYLLQCQDESGVASFISNYLDILEEKFIARALVRVGTQMVASVYSVEDGEKTDVRALLAHAEREVLRLGEEAASEREKHIKEILREVVSDLEDYHRGRAQMRGIATGLDYVDKLLCGLGGKNGNYIVLSGRPGMGKTALAMQIAMHAAIDYVWWDPVLSEGKPIVDKLEDGSERIRFDQRMGVPVGVFTLEMAQTALVQRMLFERAGADVQRWRTGYATLADLQPLVAASGALAGAGIYIDDTGRCTIDTLRAKARRMARQYGIKLFVIDYIQLMRAGGKRFRDDRVQELSEISGDIQSLGKELQIPFVVLAQMNRDYEKDPNRAPRLSDLKDCGSIEQDADLVGFLYKPKMREKEEEQYSAAMEAIYGDDWSTYPVRQNLFFAKNRYGPTGIAQLLFQKSCTRFLDWVVWLKEHGQKTAALGERQYKDKGALPTNEELEI
jgi:replicative DNA helicase